VDRRIVAIVLGAIAVCAVFVALWLPSFEFCGRRFFHRGCEPFVWALVIEIAATIVGALALLVWTAKPKT
jgi:hypothetical protein